MTTGRDTWAGIGFAGLALMLVGYWTTGPVALTQLHVGFMESSNQGARAEKAAGEKARPAPMVGHIDKPGLPAIVHMLLRVGHTEDLNGPPTRAERVFLWFLAIDVLVATTLALALLRWRRENPAARRLAVTLGLFAVALAAFLVNGQAGLRGNIFMWPSWPRLVLDVVATLAFGLSLIGLERFFSDYPVKLEDWQVLESLRLRRGGAAAKAGKANLISLARLIPKLITGILLFGTVASTLPHLLMTVGYTMGSTADGVAHSRQETIDMVIFGAGVFSGMIVLLLFVMFGWLLAASLAAKLRAAREQCTEEERRRTDWLFAGGLVVSLMVGIFSLGLLLQFLYLAWGDSQWVRLYAGSATALFFPTGWAVMLLALAGAVFLSETFGPKPLLKRTILIAGIGLMMSFLLATIENVAAGRIFSRSSNEMQHGISAVLAGGIVVFSFGFFRHRIEHGIDQFLNRFMPATVIADGKRRDATVMFSDLGGYTALSAADEPKALLMTGHFQKVAADVAHRTHGRIVKTIGDAIMWIFAAPGEAMRAAVLLREEFKVAVEKDGLVALPVNSGIHFGSVVEAPGGDVYGAAVNLASRLQGAAKQGVIIASMEAVQEVSGGFRLEPIGKLDLKNVPVPVACFQVAAAPSLDT